MVPINHFSKLNKIINIHNKLLLFNLKLPFCNIFPNLLALFLVSHNRIVSGGSQFIVPKFIYI